MDRQHIIRTVCCISVAVLMVSILMSVTVHTRTVHTCILCRAERTDRAVPGYSWQAFEETRFTDWYRTHQPEHRHMWTRMSCTRGLNVFGGTTFRACGSRHPVCDIPPDLMCDFAEAADKAELTAFLRAVASTDRDAQQMAVDNAWKTLLASRD